MASEKQITIKENSSGMDRFLPRFQIGYDIFKKTHDQIREKSYKIISALKQRNDVFIEVNSSLFNIHQGHREEVFLALISSIKELGLQYRYRKGSPASKGNIFSQILNIGPKISHEALIYVPNNVWEQEGFLSLLPIYGLRYYICKGPIDGEKTLNDLYNGQMMDEEIIRFFQLIVFDNGEYGNMGINSQDLSLNDLKQLLG